jgi:CheY-like chemotaxis protein
MNLLILVVDDEPDVEVLFRQHFRHDLRAGRFTMEFAQSAALQRITDAAGVSLILILSDINMPRMSGLELLPKAKPLRGSANAGSIASGAGSGPGRFAFPARAGMNGLSGRSAISCGRRQKAESRQWARTACIISVYGCDPTPDMRHP